MPLNTQRVRQLLGSGDLRTLFVEELGWDRHTGTLEVVVDGKTVTLQALAQKRGMVAYQCPSTQGVAVPESVQRRKIEHQVARAVHEHLIIFTDTRGETQVWQWVKREPEKPAACREHTYHRSQSGDALLQKLQGIVFSLDEEDNLTLTEVTRRARTFDVERITRRFYDRFQQEHETFLGFIKGIGDVADREWYASVMLNRLMFVYFIQRKGFLDSDRDYLRNRLTRTKVEHGKDKFYSFYRYFLLRLFHEGLGGKQRPAELEKLIGRIPYLDGGLFDVHELERPDRYGKAIQIPDAAFERIFDYFDQYQWHLDERPLRADNEINPDVLGYIFEKYINQKQMGAYYTKEDITQYICKNTVLPFLFDQARAKCSVAFDNPKGPTVWDLLKNDPDRYIHAPMRHGTSWDINANGGTGDRLDSPHPLPDDISKGLTPPTLNRQVGEGPVRTLELRKEWNKAAPPEHALPTETWREVIARRERYRLLRARLADGGVRDINELITLNLDIRQFAQDVVENCEGPDLLRAFWHAIERVTILDPTCGSGAFLFAALNILEPLYEACLDRMEAFLQDLSVSKEKHRAEHYDDFRKVLARVAAHPNRRYFIFKSMILYNVFGVDIMQEAVEICKLRLFLKLAAQVEPDDSQPNFGIEPLPDIDFNIRSGNTLVGYATHDKVKRALASRLDFDNAAERVNAKAARLQDAFDAFRLRQVEGDGPANHEDKQKLRALAEELNDELSRSLATEYGVNPSKRTAYEKWHASHQPFHWFVEFYGIMRAGGFDVIIGNPPYVEYSKVRDHYRVLGYSTEDCGNLYTYIIERSVSISSASKRFGMIVPSGGFSTMRMGRYQDMLCKAFDLAHISYFSGDANPSRLFEGVKYRLAIFLGRLGGGNSVRFTSKYLKWYATERNVLFSKITYEQCTLEDGYLRFAKLGVPTASRVVGQLARTRPTLVSVLRSSGRYVLHYHRSPVSWIRAMDFEPYFKSATRTRSDDHLRDVLLESKEMVKAVGAVLNSTHFFLWFVAQGNCRDIASPDIENCPLGESGQLAAALAPHFDELMEDLRRNSRTRVYHYETSGRVEYQEFYPSQSKSIIDKIDAVLAQHYGFTEAELDFVVSYDVKYRMGRDVEGEE